MGDRRFDAGVGKANAAAADNKVDGNTISFAASDVSVGYWNTQTRVFAANARPRNAVRITNTATIPLALGHMIGKDTSRVRASTVVMATPMSIVGLGGIAFKNNTFVASYDFSVTTTPTTLTASSNAALSSNGYVGEKNNGDVAATSTSGRRAPSTPAGTSPAASARSACPRRPRPCRPGRPPATPAASGSP